VLTIAILIPEDSPLPLIEGRIPQWLVQVATNDSESIGAKIVEIECGTKLVKSVIDGTRTGVHEYDTATPSTHPNNILQGRWDIKHIFQRTDIDNGVEPLVVADIYWFIEINYEIRILVRRKIRRINAICAQPGKKSLRVRIAPI